MLKHKDNEDDCLKAIEEQAKNTKNLYEILEKSLLGPDLSNCSCPECDSLRCFTIRRELANSICTCNHCIQSNTCLLEANANSRGSKPILKVRKSEETNKSSLKSVDFCDKTSYHETIKTENGAIDRTIQSEFYYTSDNNQLFNESSQPRDPFYPRVQSAVLRYPKKNISKNTAHLSAQIMNVPIQDFNESLSVNQPHEEIGPKLTNVKQDIFSRLKEIYKACSCKVCECIPVSSFFTRTDACSCKPCDCSECKHLYQYISNIKESPHDGCPCIRCDRKDCRGITKNKIEQRSCDCKPCNCIKCSESFSRSCNCDPCKCLECRNMPSYLARTVVVAPVSENAHSRNLCDCSPCECSNCTHNYNTTSNLREIRETSTGTVALSSCPCDTCANDLCQSDGANCRCELHKGIMKKPIQRDRHDYDIRSLLIADGWPNVTADKNIVQPEVITMHAAIQQSRLGVSVKKCECEDCTCEVCSKNKVKGKTNSSKPHGILKLPCLKNVCRCEPCECNNCNKDLLRASESDTYQNSKCRCQICDCINCSHLDENGNTHGGNKSLVYQNFVANYVPNNCNCNPCECIDCLKNNIDLVFQNVPTRENITNEGKISMIRPENSHRDEFDAKGSQKPSKPFLKAMTRGSNIQPARSSKLLKSKPRISIYRACSQKDNTSESSMKVLDCNTDDSITYFSAENSNIELTLVDDDEIKRKRKEILYYDRNTVHGEKSAVDRVALFKEKPNIICVNTTLSQNKLPSMHFDNGQILQPFLDISEQLNTHCFNNMSNQRNICMDNAYQHFSIDRPSYTENIDSLQNINPFSLLPSNNIPHKYNIGFDYDRVLSTLQDAQEFQGKLDDILQTYESANNNFVSISQRLRSMHERIFCNHDSDPIRANLLSLQLKPNSFVGDNERPTSHNESLRNVDLSSMSESSTDTETKLKPILGSHNLLENIDWLEFQTAIRKPDGCEDVYGDVMKTGQCNNNRSNVVTSRINKKYKIYQGINKHTKEVMKRIKPNCKNLLTKQVSNNPETSSNSVEKTLFNNYSDNDTDEHQDISLNTDLTFLFKDADFYKDVGTNSDIIDSTGFQYNNMHIHNHDTASQSMLETINNKQSNEDVSSKNVLTKNLFIVDDRRTQNKYNYRIPQLEANVKGMIGMISEGFEQESTTTAKSIKNLDNRVYSNVRHYLNRLISSVIVKSELKNQKRSTCNHHSSSSKPRSDKVSRRDSKYESLKASFYSLRRISDHTVLVKWNTPRDISEVQGYELQVDGRSVRKIFSPARSIAVVTCLPHNDKVLLSIRTLTSKSECNPTTTTVYYPRIK